MIYGTSLARQPITGSPLQGRSAGGWTGKPTKQRKEPSEVMLAFFAEISKAGNKTAELMPKVSASIETHPSFGDARDSSGSKRNYHRRDRAGPWRIVCPTAWRDFVTANRRDSPGSAAILAAFGNDAVLDYAMMTNDDV
jgi:hypothetical protein